MCQMWEHHWINAMLCTLTYCITIVGSRFALKNWLFSKVFTDCPNSEQRLQSMIKRDTVRALPVVLTVLKTYSSIWLYWNICTALCVFTNLLQMPLPCSWRWETLCDTSLPPIMQHLHPNLLKSCGSTGTSTCTASTPCYAWGEAT